MRAIIVDDEPVMIRYFMRECEGIAGINLRAHFGSGEKALEYAKENPVDIAFLDVEMPGLSGIELAVKLRELRSDVLIVFISAYDYVRDSNKIGGDYYLMKPYDKEMLSLMMERLQLIAQRQRKKVYLRMFGIFTVTYNGKPVPLKGKAKEILAYVAAYRGGEVSNQFIYTTIWEERPYDNAAMTVYYHALRKLRRILEENELGGLLLSGSNGQMINTDMVDCDYYAWLDDNTQPHETFRGDFLTEYPWSEPMLADMLHIIEE